MVWKFAAGVGVGAGVEGVGLGVGVGVTVGVGVGVEPTPDPPPQPPTAINAAIAAPRRQTQTLESFTDISAIPCPMPTARWHIGEQHYGPVKLNRNFLFASGLDRALPPPGCRYRRAGSRMG